MAWKGKIFRGGLILLLAWLLASLLFYHDLRSFARRPSVARTTIIRIKKGSSLRTISRQLAARQAITSPWRFTVLVQLRGLGNRLQAGEYELHPGDTPAAIIARLAAGKIKEYRLTIPEGLTAAEIGRLLAGRLCRPEEFEQLLTDADLRQRWQIPAASCEGYLFPSTYHYTATTSCREFVNHMLQTFTVRYRELAAARQPPLGLSRHQVVTMAAIIQKETGREEEMPLIAAVIVNRLRQKIPLACDPTVIYGLGEKFDGNLRRRDLRDSSPYNTYRYPGLPPGPICNPGAAALKAALAPAPVDYLYFVSRNDGSHQFSRTLEEHNRAVRRYQKHRRQRKKP